MSALRRGLAAGAVLVLLLASAAGAEAKTFGGIVADVPTGAHLHHPPSARIASALPYAGGPVLHSNRTHLIFWAPAGAGLGYDPGYMSMAETFLAGVAADSRKPTNVYGLSGQYRDAQGPAAYVSTYGGAVLATDRLPANGCTEPLGPPLGDGPGWSVCLSDAQLEGEIEHVVAANRLPATGSDIYFLLTPSGLGDCQTTGPSNCALGGSADGSYCGYHAFNPEGTILYAVIPYNALGVHCQSGNPRPNGSTADPALSTLSHEHNEMVTDPLDNAWIDAAGSENGDRCIQSYGPALGGSGNSAYDQVIHGRRYYLQEEWSNEDGGCAARDEADAISFTTSTRAQAGHPVRFTAYARDPDGSITAYAWFFGGGGSASRRIATHSFRHPGVYRIVLRSTDRAGNFAYDAGLIRVAKAPARHPPRRGR